LAISLISRAKDVALASSITVREIIETINAYGGAKTLNLRFGQSCLYLVHVPVGGKRAFVAGDANFDLLFMVVSLFKFLLLVYLRISVSKIPRPPLPLYEYIRAPPVTANWG